MAVIVDDEIPSMARLLAAGQRGEALEVTPAYSSCKAANIPGKGRGLVASKVIRDNGLVLLEPALASGASYAEVAEQLCGLVEGPDGCDATLLRQLLSLSCWGESPTSVPPLPESDAEEAAAFMKREPPNRNPEEFEEAKKLLLEDAPNPDAAADFAPRLRRRLELVARSNAFRSAADPLGALAWHALSPAEQRDIAEREPARMPSPRVFLFLRAALINHSETPNAVWLVAGSLILVRAIRPIVPGEEVLLSYWPDIDSSDALSRGMYEGFGMSCSSVGGAPEFEFSAEQLAELAALKGAPAAVASRLAAVGAGSDVAVAFDEAAAALSATISKAEGVLPKSLRAFLEPRFFQAQLTLQQGAILTARGDADRGSQLQKLAVKQIRSALHILEGAWGKRVLLRLLFAFKGALRPSPAMMMAVGSGEVGEGGTEDFSINLAKQARISPEDVRSELERAVQEVFGDELLMPAVLSKCGIPE
mmetsp:Transcript_55250/g.140068  ORF Transcript_55250/g.140068 Transcript_55250/m.140068 type:complete len:478 (-) Transcript_55250:50-1483(-)